MKVRHLPAVLRHDPLFVLTHARRMLAHTFRGSTLRTWLGLESERDAFRRFKAIRHEEREFFVEHRREQPHALAHARAGR